jgi:gluconolactonase
VRITELASNLRFPEGPIAMPDGSFILVEMGGGTLVRVWGSGKVETIAELGGGPNGAAIGPDGACYVCNNGGSEPSRDCTLWIPPEPVQGSPGRIERVNLSTGKVERLYDNVDGIGLCAPNDLVFSRDGGFWFTDFGKGRGRMADRGVVYYARPDGSFIREAIYPLTTPNGIGLSQDENTIYVAETITGRVMAYDVTGPGTVAPPTEYVAGRYVNSVPGFTYLDSLAMDSEGSVNVGCLLNGGIATISADGKSVEVLPLEDRLTTNICFGGRDLRTAYVTLSESGRLVSIDWPVAGAPLNFLNI